VPEARGGAARIVQEAQGYKQQTIALSQGKPSASFPSMTNTSRRRRSHESGSISTPCRAFLQGRQGDRGHQRRPGCGALSAAATIAAESCAGCTFSRRLSSSLARERRRSLCDISSNGKHISAAE
jgi:hypothetical protein